MCRYDESERSLDGHMSAGPERWDNRQLSLHVHLRVRPRFGESQSDNLCLTFVRKGAATDLKIQELGGRVPSDGIPDSLFDRKEHLDREGSVLVDVPQLVNDSQETTTGVFTEFPAVVRLLPLDECPGRPIYLDTLQGTSPGTMRLLDAGVEIFGTSEDRKSVGPVGLVAFSKHELPDGMVQRAPRVMDSVAANKAKSGRGRLIEQWADTYDMPRAVKGVIGSESIGVRFDEGAPFSVERVEVFLSAPKLEAGSV